MDHIYLKQVFINSYNNTHTKIIIKTESRIPKKNDQTFIKKLKLKTSDHPRKIKRRID